MAAAKVLSRPTQDIEDAGGCRDERDAGHARDAGDAGDVGDAGGCKDAQQYHIC